jgi:hypothetical protein
MEKGCIFMAYPIYVDVNFQGHKIMCPTRCKCTERSLQVQGSCTFKGMTTAKLFLLNHMVGKGWRTKSTM